MTKEQYFEMCLALDSEPIEEEIPIEVDDLPDMVTQSFGIYESLPDEWEYMGGNYVGKNLQNLFQVLDLYEVTPEERLLVYKILRMIDSERGAIIREKNRQETKTRP